MALGLPARRTRLRIALQNYEDPLITNAGVFEKTGGEGTSSIAPQIDFVNANLVRSSSGTLRFDGAFINTGRVTAAGGVVSISNLTNLVNGALAGGEWLVSGNGDLDFGSREIETVAADVTLDGERTRFNALNHLRTNIGTLRLLGSRDLQTPGDLTNFGTLELSGGTDVRVAEDFLTSGELEIAISSFSTGLPDEILSITSDTAPGGADQQLEYTESSFIRSGQIRIDGNASLGGSLMVSAIGGLEFEWGDRFRLLSFSSRSGDFDSIALPDLDDPALEWQIFAGDDRYAIEVDILTDLNSDDQIDALDLAAFDSLALSNDPIADLNSDGLIDGLDRDLVESTIGYISSQSIPAPGTVVVFSIGCATGGMRRRSG